MTDQEKLDALMALVRQIVVHDLSKSDITARIKRFNVAYPELFAGLPWQGFIDMS